MPEYYVIFARKIIKIPEFFMLFARKCSIFIYLPGKYFPIFFWGGHMLSLPPVSYAYEYIKNRTPRPENPPVL